MLIIDERGTWSVGLGRLIVVYVKDRGVVRLVHSVTGEVVREDAVEPLSRGAFRLIVEQYKKMCEI